MKTFVIKYEIQFQDGSGLLGKEIKVKNCLSSLQAQSRLEDYLKRKYSNFKALVVNHCSEDMESFLNGFAGNNPFVTNEKFNDLFAKMFGGKGK